MNRYLLLRDNKQSGPYTVAELIQKGIKPYDLVWLDGKSAAWRYPSEIEELKAYAPVVEEQPFDRFYKKPAAEKHFAEIASSLYNRNEPSREVNRAEVSEVNQVKVAASETPSTQPTIDPSIQKYAPAAATTTVREDKTPSEDQHKQVPVTQNDRSAYAPAASPDYESMHESTQKSEPVSAKEGRSKIYVTLPGSVVSRASQEKSRELSTSPDVAPVKESNLPAAAELPTEKLVERPASISPYSREEFRDPDPVPGRTEPAGSDRISTTPKYKKVEAEYRRNDPAVRRSDAARPAFGGQFVDGDILTDTVLPAKGKTRFFAGKQNVLVTLMGALCLLLGGIVIGLVISNSRKESAKELNSLVKQIQERERLKQQPVVESVTAKTEPPIDVPSAAGMEAAIIEPPAKTEGSKSEPAGKASARLAVHNQAAQNQAGQAGKKPETTLVSQPAEENAPMPVQPTVVEEKTPAKAPADVTRKNIRQLVSVKSNNYKTGVLGGISDLSLTVSNKSDYELDQVEVEVEYLGPEKRIVKTQLIVFNNVKPGNNLTLEVPRTNRGVSVTANIKTINSKSLGLARHGM